MLPDWLPESLWDEFRKMRKKIKAPLTEYAETLLLIKLDKWHTQGADCEGIINESIEKSWRGIFLNGHAACGGQLPSSGVQHPVCCMCGKELVSGFLHCSGGRKCHEC